MYQLLFLEFLPGNGHQVAGVDELLECKEWYTRQVNIEKSEN